MRLRILLLALAVTAAFAVSTSLAAGLPLVEGWNQLSTQEPAEPAFRLLSESKSGLEVEVTLPGFYRTTVSDPAGSFDLLTIGNLPMGSSSPLGAPELPLLGTMIAVPEGCVASAEVIQAEWVSFDDVLPLPVALPLRGDAEPSKIVFNPASYQSVPEFPLSIAAISTPQGWMGQMVAGLGITPFKYSPSTRLLQAAARLRIRVSFVPDRPVEHFVPSVPNRHAEQLFKTSLLNPPPAHVFDADEVEPVRMLVVVRHEARDIIQPVVDFHNSTGNRTEVWEVDDDITPAQMKDRIRQMAQDGLEYVFIIGDAYNNNIHDVPMFFWDDVDPGGQVDPPTGSGSDSWYACLDPVDRNGYDDHLPDVAVGRLVYDNANALNQLQVQVDKLMNYLNWTFPVQNGDWLGRGALIGHKERNANEGGLVYILCKQNIENREYQLPHPEWHTFYGTDPNISNATVLNFLNNEGAGFVNYRGHGDETRWYRWDNAGESWSSAQVASLRNMPFIFVASACLNGDIYDYPSQSLSERFMKSDVGGALALHCSVISTFTRGNGYFDTTVYKSWFDEGIYDLGYAANSAVASLVTYWDNDAYPAIGRVNTRAYIWQGDPALEYRLVQPVQLVVSAPDTVPIGTNSVIATVSDPVGNPIRNARVTMIGQNNALYVTGQTDGLGEAHFDLRDPLAQTDRVILSAYFRDGIAGFDEMVVADGAGSVRGRVMRLEDASVVSGATVLVAVDRFRARMITGEDGVYQVNGLPFGRYSVTVTFPGRLPVSQEFETTEETPDVNLDLVLAYSHLEVSVEPIRRALDKADSLIVSLPMQNTGNGPLKWSATTTYSNPFDPFEMSNELNPSLEVDDGALNGVVFANGKFYVAGGNNLSDPNFIYVFDRDGNEVRQERFQQPAGAALTGLLDLAYDGNHLYGASARKIWEITLQGEVVDSINGPYNTCNALTCDPSGNLWVGMTSNDLVQIDRRGNVLRSFAPNQNVRGLAWYENAPDSNMLLISTRIGNFGFALYGMNPATGRTTFYGDLTQRNTEAAALGLEVTPDYDPTEFSLLATILDSDFAYLRILHLGPKTTWLQVDPTSGEIAPGAEAALSLSIKGLQVPNQTEFSALVSLTNDGDLPDLAVPVSMVIDSIQAVGSDRGSAQPAKFAISAFYPNPFNGRGSASVSLPHSGSVKVGLFDLSGRVVLQLWDGEAQAGELTLPVNAAQLPTGIYFLRARSQGAEAVSKIVLMR